MNDLDNIIVSTIAGGITGFLASRLNSHLDSRGKITIRSHDEEFIYQTLYNGFEIRFIDKYNDDVENIYLDFSLEIRNTSKIRKDFKNARVFIKSEKVSDKSFPVYTNYMKNERFEHSMLEPLESKILRLRSIIPKKDFLEIIGDDIGFYLTISNAKDKKNEALICLIDSFLTIA